MLGLHGVHAHVVLIRPQPLGLPHDGGGELGGLHHHWGVHGLLPVQPHAVTTAALLSCKQTHPQHPSSFFHTSLKVNVET